MSIKGFHLIFITIAALFSGGFGVWALFFESQNSDLGIKIAGGVTLVLGIALIAYGVYFYRKSKNIIV